MDSGGMKEILKSAISGENHSIDLFRTCKDKKLNRKQKKMFDKILETKFRHVDILNDLITNNIAEVLVEIIPDFEVKDTFIDIQMTPNISYQDILIIGMKLVEQLLKIYNELGQKRDESEISKLFWIMAMEELNHKARLESEFDVVNRPGT